MTKENVMSTDEKELDESRNNKRKYDEVDSDGGDHIDLGHLNHTLDDSDYSTDCSACMRNQERKKKRVLISTDESDKDLENTSVSDAQANIQDSLNKVNIIPIAKNCIEHNR